MKEESVVKNLVIIGTGDFARETIWIAERINAVSPTWNIMGLIGQNNVGEMIDGYEVLGEDEWLSKYPKEIYATCAIANGEKREKIWEKLLDNPNVQMTSLIDPDAIVGKNCTIGEGCIICAGTVLTVNVRMGKSCIVNLNCTIGHDSILDNYCTVHPGTNISGKVFVGERGYIGTGTKIIQGVSIHSDTVLGAGTVVIKDIKESGTYIGCPANKVKG